MVEKSSKEDSIEKEIKAIRKNPWILSTIVVSIVALVFLVLFVMGGSGAVSEGTVKANILSFAKAQGVDATFVSAEKKDGFYNVVLSIKGQSVPVTVSLDGKYLIQSPIPLTTTSATNNSGQQTPPANVPKSDKPTVDLFVMSYCPYGTQEEKGILPVVALLKDKIDFNIKFVDYSMHGKKEVDENTVQYCIQKDQSAKYLSYLQCFLNASDSASCVTSTGIDKTRLASCVSSTDKQYNITGMYNDKSTWLNQQFPQYNIDKSLNTQYQVQGSPTLVINGVQSQSGRSPAALLASVCAAFNTAPSECSTSLATATPSAGFGYGASTADSSAAACGV